MRIPLTDIRGLLRSREEIFRDASDGRQFDSVYFAMLILSCLIALLGLEMNSPAIIIGGMLISPMMGPILACGMALTTADGPFGRKASWNLVLSTVEVVLIAVIASGLSPLKDATPEILARTNPNLMDLLVAFFSGLAGTLALSCRKSALTILPGVAVATAVMPPLATVGYGVSTAQWSLARGAFMLFFTNVTAIVISAELVFFLVGFRPKARTGSEEESLLVRHRTLIAFGILLALSIPLFRTLVRAAQQVQLRHSISNVLQQQTGRLGCRLDRIDLRVGHRIVLVEGVLQTPQFIEPTQIQQWEQAVSASVGRHVRLDLQQLQIAHKQAAPNLARNRDFVAGGTIRPAPVQLPPSLAVEVQKLQTRAQESLQSLLAPAGVGPVQVLSVATGPDGALLLHMTGIESSATADAAWSVAAAALATELHAPVRITGSLLVSGAATGIPFARHAVRPSAKAMRATDQFLAQWKNQPSVRFAFVAAEPMDELTMRRLDFLRGRYGEGVPLPPQTTPPAGAPTAGGIRIQMVHRVEAYAPLTTPKTAPAPASAPAAAAPLPPPSPSPAAQP